MNLFDDRKTSRSHVRFVTPHGWRRIWKPEEDAVLRAHIPALRAPQLVPLLDRRSEIAIRNRAKKIGLKFGRLASPSRAVSRKTLPLGPGRNSIGLKIDDCREIVEAEFGLSERLLKSSLRFRYISVPRQIAMALAHELTDKSTTQIARHFGGRDHTTAIWAVRVTAWRSAHDDSFAQKICAVRLKLMALAESRKCVSPEGLHGLMETPTSERNAEPRTDRRIASLTQAGSCGGSLPLSEVS